jgi:hypothetical protein
LEKTFIVQGKGLEEALDKAAIILHCDRERIGYEILLEPKAGRYGQPGRPCKLRVTPIAASAGELGAGGPDKLWDVSVSLTQEELASLPSSFFLKELGEALARDLASSALAALTASRIKDTRRVISGHLTPAHGSIEHVGDLHVQGSIRKGLRVKATGSIIVDGGVETAFLEAGDDIRIQEGLLGTVQSSQGSVHCRFAQGAQIEALNGDIVVAESAMHCHLHARCSITIGDQLLGGQCYGEDYVEVRIAGSESGVPTALYSGRNRALQERIEQIRQAALSHVARLEEINTTRQAHINQEEAGQALPADVRERLWRAVIRNARLNADLRRLSQEKAALLGMINLERGSRISITDRVYPRVKIGIDDTGLEVRSLTQFATFSKDYDVGEMRMTPYI